MTKPFLSLAALTCEAQAIYVYDFDGVVCSSFEDDLYNLDSWAGEGALLDQVADRFSVRCAGMAIKYQRHLLYQACALFLGLDIETGPAFQHMRQAAGCARVFVLTARSGWAAVERLRLFLKKHAIVPVEIFTVGRVPKDRQIDALCREFAPAPVYYIEDSTAHLAAAEKLDHANLHVVLAERTTAPPDPEELRQHVVDTLNAVL